MASASRSPLGLYPAVHAISCLAELRCRLETNGVSIVPIARGRGYRARSGWHDRESVAVDVGDPAAMADAMAHFGHEWPPLGGIVHAAVANRMPLVDMRRDDLAAMYQTKVQSALLDSLSASQPVQFFVNFSTAAALVSISSRTTPRRMRCSMHWPVGASSKAGRPYRSTGVPGTKFVVSARRPRSYAHSGGREWRQSGLQHLNRLSQPESPGRLLLTWIGQFCAPFMKDGVRSRYFRTARRSGQHIDGPSR